ncbi:MAG: hypothetical protein ACKVTZ_15545 [Bacteroidia bacterium]
MQPIVIIPKNQAEYRFIADLLTRMNIEIAEKEPHTPDKKVGKGLLSLAGIWEGRKINAEQLRKEAWERSS